MMSDRIEFQKRLNILNESFHRVRLQLVKQNASSAKLERLAAIRKSMELELRKMTLDDLDKLNRNCIIRIK